MKQPDRFEKIVMVEQAKHHRALFCVEIIGLLRCQHRAYVRMVKNAVSDGEAYLLRERILDAFSRYKAGR